MNFEIKPASRKAFVPLICLYAESGCGKTFSSLLMARGIAGAGNIVLVDSERGRGSLYADQITGGYSTLLLDEPYSPERYIQAIDAVEHSGAAVGIIDSGSHEWEGAGGVLEMADENAVKSGKSLNNWKDPKTEHRKFVARLMRSPIPWIICLRAKYKTRQKRENGKVIVVRDDYTSPIQAEDFIFEATAHGEIMPDHSLRLTKHSHPDLKACFPSSGPITIQTGEAIARWCSRSTDQAVNQPQPAQPAPVRQQKPKQLSELDMFKKELWERTASIHNGNPRSLEQHLWDEGLLTPEEKLTEVSTNLERLKAIVKKLK